MTRASAGGKLDDQFVRQRVGDAAYRPATPTCWKGSTATEGREAARRGSDAGAAVIATAGSRAVRSTSATNRKPTP